MESKPKYYNRDYYERNPVYKIAVLGTKAGKSTLINNLIGQKLAETNENPCTKQITKYKCGDIIYFDTNGQEEPPEISNIDLALILISCDPWKYVMKDLPYIKSCINKYKKYLVILSRSDECNNPGELICKLRQNDPPELKLNLL